MKAIYKFVIGRKKSAPKTLELVVYKGRDCRVYLDTEIEVESRQWDTTRQRLCNKYPNADSANAYLQRMVQRIEEAEFKADQAGEFFGREEIKAAARGDAFTTDTISLFMSYNDMDYKSGALKPPHIHQV